MSKPPTFIDCSVCGREFGSKSIRIHEPQCLLKLRKTEIKDSEINKNNDARKPGKRRNKVSPPNPNFQGSSLSSLISVDMTTSFSNKKINLPKIHTSSLIFPSSRVHHRPSTATLDKPRILNPEYSHYDMSLTRMDFTSSSSVSGKGMDDNHNKTSNTRFSSEGIDSLADRSSFILPAVNPGANPTTIAHNDGSKRSQHKVNRASLFEGGPIKVPSAGILYATNVTDAWLGDPHSSPSPTGKQSNRYQQNEGQSGGGAMDCLSFSPYSREADLVSDPPAPCGDVPILSSSLHPVPFETNPKLILRNENQPHEDEYECYMTPSTSFSVITSEPETSKENLNFKEGKSSSKLSGADGTTEEIIITSAAPPQQASEAGCLESSSGVEESESATTTTTTKVNFTKGDSEISIIYTNKINQQKSSLLLSPKEYTSQMSQCEEMGSTTTRSKMMNVNSCKSRVQHQQQQFHEIPNQPLIVSHEDHEEDEDESIISRKSSIFESIQASVSEISSPDQSSFNDDTSSISSEAAGGDQSDYNVFDALGMMQRAGNFILSLVKESQEYAESIKSNETNNEPTPSNSKKDIESDINNKEEVENQDEESNISEGETSSTSSGQVNAKSRSSKSISFRLDVEHIVTSQESFESELDLSPTETTTRQGVEQVEGSGTESDDEDSSNRDSLVETKVRVVTSSRTLLRKRTESWRSTMAPKSVKSLLIDSKYTSQCDVSPEQVEPPIIDLEAKVVLSELNHNFQNIIVGVSELMNPNPVLDPAKPLIEQDKILELEKFKTSSPYIAAFKNLKSPHHRKRSSSKSPEHCRDTVEMWEGSECSTLIDDNASEISESTRDHLTPHVPFSPPVKVISSKKLNKLLSIHKSIKKVKTIQEKREETSRIKNLLSSVLRVQGLQDEQKFKNSQGFSIPHQFLTEPVFQSSFQSEDQNNNSDPEFFFHKYVTSVLASTPRRLEYSTITPKKDNPSSSNNAPFAWKWNYSVPNAPPSSITSIKEKKPKSAKSQAKSIGKTSEDEQYWQSVKNKLLNNDVKPTFSNASSLQSSASWGKHLHKKIRSSTNKVGQGKSMDKSVEREKLPSQKTFRPSTADRLATPKFYCSDHPKDKEFNAVINAGISNPKKNNLNRNGGSQSAGVVTRGMGTQTPKEEEKLLTPTLIRKTLNSLSGSNDLTKQLPLVPKAKTTEAGIQTLVSRKCKSSPAPSIKNGSKSRPKTPKISNDSSNIAKKTKQLNIKSSTEEDASESNTSTPPKVTKSVLKSTASAQTKRPVSVRFSEVETTTPITLASNDPSSAKKKIKSATDSDKSVKSVVLNKNPSVANIQDLPGRPLTSSESTGPESTELKPKETKGKLKKVKVSTTESADHIGLTYRRHKLQKKKKTSKEEGSHLSSDLNNVQIEFLPKFEAFSDMTMIAPSNLSQEDEFVELNIIVRRKNKFGNYPTVEDLMEEVDSEHFYIILDQDLSSYEMNTQGENGEGSVVAPPISQRVQKSPFLTFLTHMICPIYDETKMYYIFPFGTISKIFLTDFMKTEYKKLKKASKKIRKSLKLKGKALRNVLKTKTMDMDSWSLGILMDNNYEDIDVQESKIEQSEVQKSNDAIRAKCVDVVMDQLL